VASDLPRDVKTNSDHLDKQHRFQFANVNSKILKHQNNLVTETARRPYLLLTGGTGLVGQYLLKDFLSQDKRIAVIVRPSKKLCEVQRIEVIMQRWEKQLGVCLPRPVVLCGNINQTGLGLSDSDQTWVAEHCYGILHNAAILQFSGQSKLHEPWFTNLGGTENVLAAARDWDIRHLHYVSTSYVCGKTDRVVKESELDESQTFRNDYERSKYEAEKLVAQADHFDSKTIYRPAVIVGDSETGFTSTYHGMFLYLRIFATLVPVQKKDRNGIHQTPIHLPMDGDEPRNLVPVDWVSAVICHLVSTEAAHNRTYHLVPDECSTARQFIDACCEYYNSGGVEYVGADQPKRGGSKFAELFFDNSRVYSEYLTTDPIFDKSNVEKFAGHLRCPVIDAPMIKQFIKFGETNRWGKTRPRPPEADVWFYQQMDRVNEIATRIFANLPDVDLAGAGGNRLEVGLNVLGRGGGQWTLVKNKSGKFSSRAGLPAVGQPTLQIEAYRLEQLLTEIEQLGQVKAGHRWDLLSEQINAAIALSRA